MKYYIVRWWWIAFLACVVWFIIEMKPSGITITPIVFPFL
jgi:hypothetical protein